MFKYIYIILGIVLFISILILFVKLATLGKHGLVINEKAQNIQPKLENIQRKSEELEALTKSLNEYKQNYGPVIKSLTTILFIYRSYKRNIKKKSGFRAFMKNLRLLTRPNSMESYKTIINLFKKNV